MKKRLLAALCALIMLLSSFSAYAVSTPAGLGDVDGDGRINTRDSAIIARYLANWTGYVTKEGGGLTFPGDLSDLNNPTEGPHDRSGFQAGFGTAEMKFPLDESVPMGGYGDDYARRATERVSPILANCVAFRDESGNTLLLISADLLSISADYANNVKDLVSKKTGVPAEYITVSCTHSHGSVDISCPYAAEGVKMSIQSIYYKAFTDACAMAIKDLDKSELYTGDTEFEGYNSVRRYFARYKRNGEVFYGWRSANDGRANFLDSTIGNIYDAEGKPSYTTKTTAHNGSLMHETEVDKEVQYIYVERANQEPIVLFNWQNHAANTGSKMTYFTSDFVNYARTYLENKLGCKAIFFQGACGNVSGGDGLLKSTSAATKAQYESSCKERGEALANAVINDLPNKEKTESGTIRVAFGTYKAEYDMGGVEIELATKAHPEMKKTDLIQKLIDLCQPVIDAGNYNTTSVMLDNYMEYVPGYYQAFYYASRLKSRLQKALAVSKAEDAAAEAEKVYKSNPTTANKTAWETAVAAIETATARTTDFPYSAASIGDSISFAFTSYEMFDTNGMTVKHGYRLKDSSNWVQKNIPYYSSSTSTTKLGTRQIYLPYAEQDLTNTNGSKFKTTFMCELTNGANGYIPSYYSFHLEEKVPAGMTISYPNGYEIYSTSYVPKTGDEIAEAVVVLLDNLYNQATAGN